jgi:hypothetical protein
LPTFILKVVATKDRELLLWQLLSGTMTQKTMGLVLGVM